MNSKSEHVTWDEFQKIEIRVGTIVEVKDFPEALKPDYKIKIDLGEEIVIIQSSAQITDLYSKDGLLGRQIIAVTNFPPKKIGPFTSECLITGFYRKDNKVVLAIPDDKVENGSLLV